MANSVTKALQLLKALGSMPEGGGVRELGRMSEINPSTVHALLKSLLAQGFVAYEESTRRYRLGLVVATLGAAIDRVAMLRAVVQPHVDAAFAELGESVTAVAWHDGRALVVGKHQSTHQLITAMPDGVVPFPHRWASGLLLLAHQPLAVRQSYAAAVGSLTDLPDEAAFEKVRAATHTEAIDMDGSGIAALAVPVVDALGAIRLALAVSAPLARLPHAQRESALEILHQRAAAIASVLGATV